MPTLLRRLAFATPLLLAASACDPVVAPDPLTETALRQFEGCDDLRERLIEVTLESMVRGGGWWGMPEMMEDMAATTDDGDSGSAAPTDYTTTNTQESGVDELDLVKTNGTHLFVAQDRGFHVVSSWPVEDTETLASIELEGWARGLFLVDDNTLVLFEDVWSWYGHPLDFSGYDGVRIHTIDVSDPANPSVTKTVSVEGHVTDARMIGGKVHAVIQQWLDIPNEVWDLMWDGSTDVPEIDWSAPVAVREAQIEDAKSALRPAVRRILNGATLRDMMPLYKADADTPAELLHHCDDLYAPQNLTPHGMLTVATLDPEAGTFGATGILSDGWNIYASQDNLYVAQNSGWWWGFETSGLSHIHTFAVGGEEPVYTASGAVDGWLYDQFAMSEYDGHLRVATTDYIDWTQENAREDAANNIFVLRDDGAGTLETVGEVRGFGEGEQIMAARMMGEKGYVVTFEQTDPLFTVDLSDPTAPALKGELMMPGYSGYLHPLGDDHLLAIGMAGLETGELTGVAVNMFDVSDLSDPQLIWQHEIDGDGWAWSEALWDHHAFTFHRDVLTIPAYTEQYDSGTGRWQWFSGSISLHATVEDGITELGRVDHRELVEQSDCLYSWWWEYDAGVCNNDYWWANVRRSVYVEDNLFTISDYGVKVNELNDPSRSIATALFYPAD